MEDQLLTQELNVSEEVEGKEGIKIIRSSRRRKSVSARLCGSQMIVRAPKNISETELNKIVNKLRQRFTRRKLKQELNKTKDLKTLFDKFNQQYFNGVLMIESIEYTAGLNSKFGWCDYRNKRIKISHFLANMPEWVRDYVIIHEMAHLIEPNHSQKFYDIANRYKLAERARGYLMAKNLTDDGEFSL